MPDNGLLVSARKCSALVVLALVAGVIASPAEAKKPAAVQMKYHMAWFGDCGGKGYLSLKKTPSNPDTCALFFPGVPGSYTFSATEGMPFAVDATKALIVDFTLDQVASGAADFEVVVSAKVNGKDQVLGSGTQTVLAGTYPADPVLHYELKVAPALDKAKVTHFSIAVTWTKGVTYSKINFEAGPSVVLGAFK